MKNVGVWEITIFQSIHPCVKQIVCLAKVNTSIMSSFQNHGLHANWSPQMKQALRPAPPPENKAGNVG